ncbi:MAG: PBP1A family penicillin-binding protein [Deltaproteobacteria bacterium]|nr:PBP1A family penicillin-binding protein [Candidatus Anaeroferrophillacea bacterium]
MRFRRTFLLWLLIPVVIAVVGTLGTAAGVYCYFSRDLPRITSLKDYRPLAITEVYADGGELIGRYYLEKRKIVPIEEIPTLLKRAFIAGEDSRFYEHPGLDFLGVFRALIKNIAAGRVVQGGSTITQQVTKSLLLTPERKLKRKIREAILAWRIEKYLSKEEILFLYLNQIYLGHGSYGVEIAAQTYFGKHTRDLTLAEMAILAGLPKAPSRYSPISHPERARRRQVYVIGRMVEEGYISAAEARAALAEPLVLPERSDPMSRTPYFTEHVRRYLDETYGYDRLYKSGMQVYTTVDVEMQAAARVALDGGLRALDKRQGFQGPLKTCPPLGFDDCRRKLAESVGDPAALAPGMMVQALVERVDDAAGEVSLTLGIRPAVLPLEKMRWARRPEADGTRRANQRIDKPSAALEPGDVVLVRIEEVPAGDAAFPVTVSLEQNPEVQGAVVALDPFTGMVRAMVGGRSFAESEFNRAIQSRRSPGSAFKPIIYAAGLDRGLTPATIFLDNPVIYQDPDAWDEVWKPQNYEQRFYGPTSLRQALVHSRNLVTIKVLKRIGIPHVIAYAQMLGIESELSPDLTLALGSSGVSLMELTRAYAVFANGGYRIGEKFIKRIENRDGEIIEDHEPLWVQAGGVGQGDAPVVDGDRAISPQTAYLMASMLESVVERGTGRRARELGRPLAGKTGTTNDYFDAWFLGFAPQLVAGVWVGFDELKPLGRHETGSRAACPIWIDFMDTALKRYPKKPFTIPTGIVFAKIDPETGLLATPRTENPVYESFREGTEPKQFSTGAAAANLEEELFKDLSGDLPGGLVGGDGRPEEELLMPPME